MIDPNAIANAGKVYPWSFLKAPAGVPGDPGVPGTPVGELGSLTPARVFESRPGLATVDGQFAGGGRIVGGSVVEILIAGRGGVPGDASAVMLNVTAIGPSAPGFLTVFACGVAVPNASNVNYTTGDVVPNAVLAGIGTGGKVCVDTKADTDLIIDVNGHV